MADISAIKLPNGVTYNIKDTSKSDATNWVNGSATGSVRTVGSAAEDTNYTMGTYAVAEGIDTKASGEYGSHAEGAGTVASSNGSHAEGLSTTASNYGAHAEGTATVASGYSAHAEGSQTNAYAEHSHAEGHGTQVSSSASYGHAEGGGTTVNATCGHTEGSGTRVYGKYAHAEGSGTSASGEASHAEGTGTYANGNQSHAEGGGTSADGAQSHAEGSGTSASGASSHAEGSSTSASGEASHAEGSNTIANHLAQHVFGEYNIVDTSTATKSNRGNYVEIVGNGSDSTRSNARTLDWSGNEVLAGKLTVGAVGVNSMDVATVGQLPTVPANIVNTITTTAGTHTAISNKKGNVSFNVPTKTSHLTNDSGYLTGITSSQVTTALGYTPYNSTNPNGYTSNTGTVTKVTAGTGLSIGTTAGGNFTTSGTINHTNSVTAQTTQAVYPIKIDAQGHISAYGSAVTIPTVNNATLTIQKNGTTVKSFTANASSNVTANITVPTKVSELTNDSGYAQLAGASFTGPVTFGSSVSIDEATLGDLVVTGAASFTNNINANTINGVSVGNSPKFTDTVTTITTTAGAHTAISSKSGAVSFNVPTKTSHLTNDSGFITASHTSTYSLPLAASGTRGGVKIGYSESGTNYAVKLSSEKMYVTVPWTDTKVTTAALTSGTTYYPILATGTGTATRQIDSTLSGLKYVSTAGTTSAVGAATLYLGNTTGSGTANNEQGVLRLYSSNATYYTDLKSSSASSNKTITLPNQTGTVALTSDIPTIKGAIVHEFYTIPSRSYAANSVYWHYNDNRIPTKTGYTAIGIVGYSQNSGSLVSNLDLADGKIAGYTWNRTTSAVSMAISVDILYLRNDLIET